MWVDAPDAALDEEFDDSDAEFDEERGDPAAALNGDVDPATWRHVVLRAAKTDGTWADVELLRPADWLAERGAQAGGTLDISVPECGIDGTAHVLAIRPCPAIPPGLGRVVTGTFAHRSAHVIDLRVEGLADSIGTTANHPFWSEDRQDFVRADQLVAGERLLAFDGPTRVLSATPRSFPEPVYNLEVQLDHVYHVGESGVLVHNSLPFLNCPFFLRPAAAGEAGSFGLMNARRVAGDLLTPHHMPQAALSFTGYNEGGTLVLTQAEHFLTRTFGGGGTRLAAQEAGLPFRTVLARDIWDIRRIAGSQYNRGLLDLIGYYGRNFPQLLAK